MHGPTCEVRGNCRMYNESSNESVACLAAVERWRHEWYPSQGKLLCLELGLDELRQVREQAGEELVPKVGRGKVERGGGGCWDSRLAKWSGSGGAGWI